LERLTNGRNKERYKMAKSYWGYRIDTRNIKFFNEELKKGRLRQGWGYEEWQKLPSKSRTGGAMSGNENFKKQCDDSKITPLFTEDLSELLYQIGRTALFKQES
jgi:hypothetical protein